MQGSMTQSNDTGGFLKSTRGTVIRIEALVVVAALVLLLLAAFGSRRRRSSSWLIQKGVLGAFALFFTLVTYTLGSMQSSEVKSSMYPIWAMSLYILAGCPDSITAYSLDDNNQTTRLKYQFYLNYAYVLLVIAAGTPGNYWFVLIVYLHYIAVSKIFYRMVAYRLASRSWNLNKMVADYMYEEHTMTNHEETPWDPVSMKGYCYPVDWPLSRSIAKGLREDDPKVIDIEKIWGCGDESETALSPELKDACLSFSLFHLLRRRFFGFACAESTQQKTHDFVFKGLLLAVAAPAENEERTVDYDRVFKVIEVELAFMYDFFFTKYAALYYAPWKAKILSILSAILLTAAAAYLYLVAAGRVYMVPKNATAADVFTAALIIAFTALLELVQLLLYWTSIWGRVSFACQNLRRGSCLSTCVMRCKQLLTKIGVYCASRERYWQHKLGQYSLIDLVSYNPHRSYKPNRCITWAAKFYPRLWIPDGRLFEIPHRATLSGRKHAVGLPAVVKEALVDSLVRTDGKLTNGESSLVSNGAGDLSWACAQDMRSSGTSSSQDQENQAHLILTWHIATCYCEMARLRYPRPSEPADLQRHVQVATKLSQYCAYLVVSAPRLLPGHHYDTLCVFHEFAEEAAQYLLFKGDMYEAMRNLPESPTDETIFHRGVVLGKQLEEMEDVTLCWKVLADFWAELLLYVAPSDNVKDHIESLAQGGELVTHLWALLSHAGILKREDHHRNVGNM